MVERMHDWESRCKAEKIWLWACRKRDANSYC